MMIVLFGIVIFLTYLSIVRNSVYKAQIRLIGTKIDDVVSQLETQNRGITETRDRTIKDSTQRESTIKELEARIQRLEAYIASNSGETPMAPVQITSPQTVPVEDIYEY